MYGRVRLLHVVGSRSRFVSTCAGDGEILESLEDVREARGHVAAGRHPAAAEALLRAERIVAPMGSSVYQIGILRRLLSVYRGMNSFGREAEDAVMRYLAAHEVDFDRVREEGESMEVEAEMVAPLMTAASFYINAGRPDVAQGMSAVAADAAVRLGTQEQFAATAEHAVALFGGMCSRATEADGGDAKATRRAFDRALAVAELPSAGDYRAQSLANYAVFRLVCEGASEEDVLHALSSALAAADPSSNSLKAHIHACEAEVLLRATLSEPVALHYYPPLLSEGVALHLQTGSALKSQHRLDQAQEALRAALACLDESGDEIDSSAELCRVLRLLATASILNDQPVTAEGLMNSAMDTFPTTSAVSQLHPAVANELVECRGFVACMLRAWERRGVDAEQAKRRYDEQRSWVEGRGAVVPPLAWSDRSWFIS